MENPRRWHEGGGQSRTEPVGSTAIVINWMLLKGLDDPAFAEAMEIVRGGKPLEQAADQLRVWFTERLTVDPGMPGPFADLASNLISWALEDVNRGVNWQGIVGALRQGEL